jgi:anti-anti-sigma factor
MYRPSARPPDRGGCCHTAIVTVRGDLDATSIGQFRQVLELALSTCYRRVVIDLSAADFVSIEAAARLGEARREARRLRLDLTLVTGPPAVEHVLQVTGVRDLFSYHSSLRSAVEPAMGDAARTAGGTSREH